MVNESSNLIVKDQSGEELWQRIQVGDKDAFSDLFKQYYESLYRIALRFVNDTQLAENVAQEIFVKIWVNRTKYKIRTNLKSFLFTAVRNQCLNELKQQKRTVSISTADFIKEEKMNSPEEDLIILERKKAVHKAIDKLPRQCRQIYLMKKYDDLKYTEIAEILNISINTVKTQMKRAMKSLLKQLSSILNALFLMIK